MSVGTAFYPRQQALNIKQAWGEWAGYFAPAVYADFHDIEYSAIREAAAVIDTSPLYKYVVRGADAGTAARSGDHARRRRSCRSTRSTTRPGATRRARSLDDGTVTRIGRGRVPDHRRRPLLPVVPAERDRARRRGRRTCRRSSRGWPCRASSAARCSRRATRQDWTDLRYFRHRRTEIGGVDVSVTRTGYTGDRGYELWIPADGALEVWDAVFEAGAPYGIFPAGIRALDVARVEAGLILIEAEYTSARHAIGPEQSYSPFEIGLGRLVDFGKAADFDGRRALLAEQQAGGPRPAARRPRARLGGIEGMFAKHGLAPMISPFVDRAPGPRLQGQQAGRPGDVDHLGHHDQEDGRVRLPGQGAREDRHPGLGRVQRRGRARARSPPRWSRCRSSTCLASEPEPRLRRRNTTERGHRDEPPAMAVCPNDRRPREAASPDRRRSRGRAARSAAGADRLVCTLARQHPVGHRRRTRDVVVDRRAVRGLDRAPPARSAGDPTDRSRRRFLATSGSAGVALVAGGAALGRVRPERRRAPTRTPSQEAAADRSSAREYMELVARASHAGRSGDLQLLLAPFNSANYSFESLGLHPRDPRTSHAAVWMYLERVPLVAYGPGVIEPGDSDATRLARRPRAHHREPDRVRRVARRPRRTGRCRDSARPGGRPRSSSPTSSTAAAGTCFAQWPNDWPNLKRLMREGATLPQRADRIVPRRDRVRARDDRHRHVPTHARHHRAQHPRRRHRAEGVRHAGRTPIRATSWCRRSPTCGTTRPAPGSARSATRSGTWGCSATAARTGRPPTCPSASTSTSRAATAGSRTTPSLFRLPAGRARDGRARGAHGDLRRPGLGPRVGAVAHRLLLRAADRRVPGRPARGRP